MNHALSPEKALIFRIVHVKNVPWILDNGLHCRNSDCLDPDFVNIGNLDLIQGRKPRPVPLAPGGTLSDYVPFYFTPFSIMLFQIVTGFNVAKHQRKDIVILVSSLHRLKELDISFLFTDRHAYPVSARYFDHLGDLGQIDWPLLQSKDFKQDPDDPGKKERYQAEALAYQHVPANALLGIVCYTESVQQRLRGACSSRKLDIKVEVRPGWYF